MRLILVTGGARSGKSRYAERSAGALSDVVTYVATAEPIDEEMEARIRAHRATRLPGWITVEARRGAARAVRDAGTEIVLLDCLTLLVSNAMVDGMREDGTETTARARAWKEIEALMAAADARPGTLLVVTNEVGQGVVPATPLGRWFRDMLGDANRRLAEHAEEVVLLVSGIPLHVKGGT